MSKQFTPGPWWHDHDGTYPHEGFCVLAANPYSETDGLRQAGRIETEANARLIAAAPDLYEALVAAFSPDASRGEWVELARAALRKAQGHD